MNPSLATRLRAGLAILFVLLVGVTAAGVGRLFDLRTDYERAIADSYRIELELATQGRGEELARQQALREELRGEVASDTRTTLVLIGVGLGCALGVGLLVFAAVANAMAKAEESQATAQLKDEFLATVSHELRSPLTSMQGFAELLLVERDGLSEEQIHHIEVILSANHRLTEIVNDLLDLARSDAGRLRIEPRPSEVEPIVGDVTRLLERRMADKGQRLEVDLEAALPLIEADPSRIVQVLGNLLTNAHLYTPEGGTIRIAGRRADGSRVELSISDTGPGMSREQLDHAFDRFWRADATDSRTVGGTGLGLAIARSLVELHGGEIEASSPPGGGASFRVLLPTAQTRATG